MKKILVLIAILLFFTNATQAVENKTNGYVSVNFETVKEVNPTKVNLSFAIETTAKDPKEVADLNKETSQKVIDSVKTLVNIEAGETIKTTSYNLNPQYVYKNGQRNLIGYVASNNLQVTLKDVEKAGKIIAIALANGANSVSNLQFLLDNTDEECNNLIVEATNGAKLRATKIANAANSDIYKVKMISANCSSQQRNFSNYRIMNAKAEAADSAVGASIPVEAGKTQLRAFVSAEFYVK